MKYNYILLVEAISDEGGFLNYATKCALNVKMFISVERKLYNNVCIRIYKYK